MSAEVHDIISDAILEIGCGPKKQVPNAIGLDIYPFPGVDVVRDLRRGLPWGGDCFDGIVAHHVLEHFAADDLMFVVEEMYRVSAPSARWDIEVPDASSPNRYRDPMHLTRDWHEDSFMLWEVDEQGNWPIYVGPMYQRRAKLRRIGSSVSDHIQRDRRYIMEVVK